MSYFRECPICHCNLDPEEPCDCQEDKEQEKAKENNEKEAKSA